MTNRYVIQAAGSLLLLIAVSFTACQQKQPENKQPQNIEAATVVPDSITVVPFEVEGGWGYKIKFGQKTFINQDFIPVIMGRKPFQSKEDALKVGENLATKMRNGEGKFPNLTRQELLDMKIAGVE
jgi:hypothetical protein